MSQGSSSFDHIIFAVADLDEGVRIIEQKTGVKAVRGGIHPHLGTCNALLSLGKDQYLEILAPNPGADLIAEYQFIRQLSHGKLIMWAAHTDKIESLLEVANKKGYANTGVSPGQRKTEDGKMLSWKTLATTTEIPEIMPFFIQWGKDTAHPATTSPHGCELESFNVFHPKPDVANAIFKDFNLNVKAEKGDVHLSLQMKTPKGSITL